ncbi:hypothetical protein FRB99_004892 [Tulasnella sp. 403]|nr:hypothetical protein FRB99_004892 [Tulasnella sp. 403]
MSPLSNSNAPRSHTVSKKGSTIETSSGTLHVQPYRPSKYSNRLLAKLTFVPRASHFESSGQDAFRGFYVLFWISVGLLMLRTYVSSFDQTGYPLSLSFAALFSKDALPLAISDAVLVGSTALCVPFVKLLISGRIRYTWTGIVIQHLYQATMLGIAVKWIFNRHWEWVQSGFFTLHCLVMIMKIHSYVSVNGSFAELYLRKQEETAHLEAVVEALPGGWPKAEADALAARFQTARNSDSPVDIPGSPGNHSTGSEETPAGTPAPIANGIVLATEVMDRDLTSMTLRKRLAALPGAQEGIQMGTVSVGDGTPPSIHSPPSQDRSYFPSSTEKSFTPHTADQEDTASQPGHPLLGHPDTRVNELAESISNLDAELTSNGINRRGRTQFPDNVTLWNFVDYQMIPTLVYELEYPRTERYAWVWLSSAGITYDPDLRPSIRPSYVFEKTVAFLGCFTLLYTIAEHYIIPLTPQRGQSFFRSLLDLALPFMLSYLLLFYIIFECICNGFAELSRFADRQFYEDWWNSTSWDEFSRKWNKPVHSFLLRHVYASSISYHKLTKPSAAVLTFLLSALLHELVMAVVTKKIRMYLFGAQMAQIPLIALGRLPVIKQNAVLGNVVFWAGLMTGFPLLCVAYCAY